MGIGKQLNNEIMPWIGLAITIVVGSIVLVKFKDVDGNTTATNATVDTFVGAIDEPENWVAIVIIAVVGGYILKLFNKK